ncbi:hypothetical protein H5410_000135 [Solanum commersonii]|uniref:Uncharacterized protein n=1 Tax=Solanum commersonii TaxID=4109 RepID=A0A9J6AVY3_SOLCO|nr:hypothetical protein H5410_000135 [Solanum commersonii]
MKLLLIINFFFISIVLHYGQSRVIISELEEVSTRSVIEHQHRHLLLAGLVKKIHFSGEISSSLGKFRGLKMLNISYNGLRFQQLLGIWSLNSIDLSHNSFSGPIPQSFTKLQQLTTLDVSNTTTYSVKSHK